VALLGAKVEMVSVAVPALVPIMFNGDVVPKENVGKYCAPDGLVAIIADSDTLPSSPPPGVTVIVEVFPVAAPAATVTDVPITVIVGAANFIV
jgi:hypothetical protein